MSKIFNQRKKKADLSPLLYGKIPPQAIELETAILGAMMFDPQCILKVCQVLRSEDYFYSDAHQRIFAAIKTISDRGGSLDFMIVIEELRKRNELEIVGGSYYVTQLIRDIVSSANIEEHCRIVAQKKVARDIISISGRFISDSYDDTEDVFDVLQNLRENVDELHHEVELTSTKTLHQVIDGFIKTTNEEIEKKKKGDVGVKTYFPEYDDVVGNLQGGNVYVWAARTSMGKTACEVDCFLKQSMHIPVGVWNGELTEKRFMRRCISNLRKITVQELQQNPEQHMDEILKGVEDLFLRNLHIVNKRGMVIDDLVNLIKFWVFKHGVRIVWLDYLQIIKLSEKLQNIIRNRTEQIGYIIDALNEVAAICDIPIIILAQLNREATKGDKKPNLAHLRDSGSIEERVYHVMFIHRPEYYGEQEYEGKSTEGMLQWIIAKNGDANNNLTLELKHELKYNRIYSMKEAYQEYAVDSLDMDF